MGRGTGTVDPERVPLGVEADRGVVVGLDQAGRGHPTQALAVGLEVRPADRSLDGRAAEGAIAAADELTLPGG